MKPPTSCPDPPGLAFDNGVRDKEMKPKFIVDINVGKLAKWLRVMGYDTLFIKDISDDNLIRIGLQEGRVVLTKDSHILRRRIVTSGQLKALHIRYDDVTQQLRQVIEAFNLDSQEGEFSLCIECNRLLMDVQKDAVRHKVPPFVLETHSEFVSCPGCRRIYWQGTHWHRMKQKLDMVRVQNA